MTELHPGLAVAPAANNESPSLAGVPPQAGQIIRDPIHGAIRLGDHERDVIDHRLFQRLRHICQNDILNLVFPGASHARFIHSIGAMEVATRMLRGIVDDYLYRNRLAHLPDAMADGVRYLEACLRLAMLLHDSGHGPFSHQMEFTPQVRAMLDSGTLFAPLWKDAPWRDYYESEPDILHHEHYSVRVAHQILADIDVASAGVEARDAITIMETTTPNPSGLFEAAAEAAWPVFAGARHEERPGRREEALLINGLLRAIVSGELDADKCDYILRDATHCSVSYGQISLDTLISMVRSGWIPEERWMGLALVRKGISLFEDFVHSRFQLYRHIYNHKTAVGFDVLLQRAIGEFIDSNADNEALIRDYLTDLDAFADITDTFFWEAFRRMRRVPGSYGGRMVDRTKLHHVGSYENLPKEDIPRIRGALAAQLGTDDDQIVYQENLARFSKISRGYGTMRVIDNDPVSETRTFRRLAEVSDFFGKFGDLTITHFYQL